MSSGRASPLLLYQRLGVKSLVNLPLTRPCKVRSEQGSNVQRYTGRLCMRCQVGYYPFFQSCEECGDKRGKFQLVCTVCAHVCVCLCPCVHARAYMCERRQRAPVA